MCLINTFSFKFSGKSISSAQDSSFNDFTFDLSAVKSPIFFININDAITRPIPTAYTKFQKVESSKTTIIIKTSELSLMGPILTSLGKYGIAFNPL